MRTGCQIRTWANTPHPTRTCHNNSVALPPSRHYRGQRVLRISCRTIHIGSAVLVLGAAYYQQLDSLDWWALPTLIGSGMIIMIDDFLRRGWHLFRLAQFWVLAFKLVILGLGVWHRSLLLPALWTSLVVGSVVSHIPGYLRHYELWGESRTP